MTGNQDFLNVQFAVFIVVHNSLQSIDKYHNPSQFHFKTGKGPFIIYRGVGAEEKLIPVKEIILHCCSMKSGLETINSN